MRLRAAAPGIVVVAGGLALPATATATPTEGAAAPVAPAVPTEAGAVVAWGSDYYGQSTVPDGLNDVVDVAAGSYHSLALRSDGTVVQWGDHDPVPEGLADVVDVEAGAYWSAALRADGTVVAWGSNEWGNTEVPADLDDVVQISAGADFGLALRSDGTVAQWGGDNPGDPYPVPDDLADVVAVSGGGSHRLALLADGTVTEWGSTGSGLGSPPAGLDDVVAIDAGNFHNLAVRSDGTVAAWGRDGTGPADVPEGLSDVVDVDGGLHHSLALLADGTVVGWGEDTSGQATPPEGLTDVVAISAGASHSLAIVAPGDTTAPVITVPDVVEATATSSDGAVVSYEVTAVDDVDGAVATECVPGSGAAFPLGTTSVTCTATDAAGNVATAAFPVAVTYSWSGFHPPVKDHRTTVVKGGRTLPVSFSLTRASARVRDADATLWYAPVTDGVVGERVAATSRVRHHEGNDFRYLRFARTYAFLWSTPREAGEYVLVLDLGDGVERSVPVRVR